MCNLEFVHNPRVNSLYSTKLSHGQTTGGQGVSEP